ncbi:exonuclease V subunit alpha [Fructilactobacillus fructivorans]|nr:exonuclease V subunit alpha [Fructilactobacillus fructivorans]
MSESMDLFQTNEKLNNSAQDEHLYVKGQVQTTFFESSDSFYKVLLVKVNETDLDWHEDEIVITGNFADISDDVTYRFVGKLVDHPKYGKQFQAENYERVGQNSKKGLINYLSGSEFTGIGPKTAEKVVNQLGTSLIEKILENPAVLNSVGLTKKQKDVISQTVHENNGVEQTIVGLNSYGFGSNLASAIFKKYKEQALEVIKTNPYQLVEDISGISFKRADRIANKVGVDYNAKGRLRAGLLTALDSLSIKSGNTYSDTRELMQESTRILETDRTQQIDNKKLGEELYDLAKDQKIVVDEDKIYLKNLYDDELRIAENMKRIEQSGQDKQQSHDFSKIIQKVEKEVGIEYDESQKKAINEAMINPAFLLTGGPGTGKTTIINGIVRTFAKANDLSLDINDYKEQAYPVLLAAPTGRAAKKMSDSTKIPASTIHRLLGLTGHGDEEAANDLEGGLLIVDEMSMVDTDLFKILSQAIPNGMKVIFVGDKDQLPSVGPGQVFYDLLRSHTIPSVELNQIHRQNDGSTIVELAHDIKNGAMPQTLLVNQRDRSFINCNTQQVESVIKQVVNKAKVKGFSSTDVQVLAPMYRGSAGIDRLNVEIQNIMNPPTSEAQKEVDYRGTKYRIGDKVLQLVNVPENNIFNGDIGKVVGIEINKENKHYLDKLTIAFDQNEVTYTRNDWNQLTLAYCTSIHKAQGSEFKMVILPIVPQYRRMLKRNLLYTAVTRASKMLIMLGDPNSFEECIENESVNRKTTLKQRLQYVINEEYQPKVIGARKETPTNSKDSNPADFILSEEKILGNDIDPMIGMQGITPQNFNNDK